MEKNKHHIGVNCQAIITPEQSLWDKTLIFTLGQMGNEPNRIRYLRRIHSLSQAALAEKASTTQQQITRLERGERELTVTWLKRLAIALECHPSDLLPDGLGLTPRARAMALMFEKLPEDEQQRLLKICDAIIEPMTEKLLRKVMPV